MNKDRSLKSAAKLGHWQPAPIARPALEASQERLISHGSSVAAH